MVAMTRRPRSFTDAFDQPGFFVGNEDLTVDVDPLRFPNNFNNRTAGSKIERDLRTSQDPLIITGFTSLEKVVEYLAPYHRAGSLPPRLRLLLGHEPTAPQHDTIDRRMRLPRTVADYWLEQGFSLRQCSAIVASIEVLERGRSDGTIEVRTSDDSVIHAKIYVGDDAITTGSSNFSYAGLRTQIESNVRFTRQSEPDRWEELARYADWVWMQGRDYLDELIDLLRLLLSSVTWEEALARACAEVLEGDWARRYIAAAETGDTPPLWPTQRQGIAQALWVMENVGSVLVADATGSGKTRMGVHLIKAAVERMWRTGQKRVDAPVLTCPKAIEASWRDEFSLCRFGVDIYTHGVLSRPDSKQATRLGHALRQVQIFAIDEAHNFLDHSSQRTRTLYGNLADYVVLFTATPINKGASDLVAMIDILGADNFEDETLDLLERTLRRGGRKAHLLTANERDQLSHAIERFMVRRTIGMFNTAIDHEPQAYRDVSGRACRYPVQHASTYACPETPNDTDILLRIREQANQLRGLVYIGQQLHPMQAAASSRPLENELETRLKMAANLARYHVLSSLRSSRAALIEHVCGTEDACRFANLSGSVKGAETGNQLRRLEEIADAIPESTYPVPLPDWLTEPVAHREACRIEAATYTRISDLARSLSSSREEFKAQHLAGLVREHDKVVAFDWHLITLWVIQQRLQALTDAEVLIATGASPAMRERTRALFDPDIPAPSGRAIALCSDAMSESIGLQRASAMSHLDLPTTIRKAEQRVGRLMRMNSPHPAIEVFWPIESSLSLSGDDHIVERHQTVDVYIGANLVLPQGLTDELYQTDELTRQTRSAEEMSSEDLGDAFGPVRGFIEGADALIPPNVYAEMRTSKARVLSTVSVVRAARPWAFFAIAGTEWGAPRWVYVDNDHADLVIDIDKIAAHLRRHLGPETQPHDLDDAATALLDHFIDRVTRAERLLLPKKKQRALDQMSKVVQRYIKRAKDTGDLERIELCSSILHLVEAPASDRTVDYRVLADCWLTLITPLWTQRLREQRKRRPLRIKDLTTTLLKEGSEIGTIQLRATFGDAPLFVKPLDRRIVSAIVGVA
jgi:SNF2-related domain